MPDQTPLSLQEIEEVKRLFGSPFFIPPNFKTWMAEQLALNIPDLPLGSLFGGRGITRSLEASLTSVAAPGNGTTTDLYSKIVQGRTLGANGRIRFVLEGNVITTSGSTTWFLDLVFGGTTIATVSDNQSSTNRHIVVEGEIYNSNSPAVQFGQMTKLRLTDGSGVSNVAIQTDNGEAAVDTSVDQALKLQLRWAGINANDIFTRSYINVEIVNPVPLGAAA